MIITSQKAFLREQIASWKQAGLRVGFVPTMGNLHEGHLRLIDAAKEKTDKVVASIFVNPTQFDKADDLENYPQTLEEDCNGLQQHACDLVFTPETASMYADTENTSTVHVPGISDRLEGSSRSGHFTGVATIVCKLFNLVTPDIAVFGEKDFQQLMVIRQMVSDLAFNIEIVGHPTVRDEDGLAMSSRNGYLTSSERLLAPHLYAVLTDISKALQNGNNSYEQLSQQGMQTLNENGFRSDYIEIRRQKDLLPPEPRDKALVILAAAWLGKARLIDNIPVDITTT